MIHTHAGRARNLYFRRPQWSPSTEDGTTTSFTLSRRGSYGAAMEPVHGGRDDR
jgi:hypothetical protein